MGERYWISGVQLGMLRTFNKNTIITSIESLLTEIEETQFIGRIEQGEKGEVVIIGGE